MNVTITPGLLRGAITPPPSKSQAHRLLIAAALADGPAGKHIFTHIEWEMRAYFFRCRELSGAVPFGELDRHPLPSAFSAFFRFFRQLRNGEVLI